MKYLILSLGLLMFVFTSCEKLSDLTKFDMDFDQTITMPPVSVVDIPFQLTTPDIATQSEATFEGNNTSKNLIEEIVLKSLTLDLESPTDGDFGFMESIAILMSADGLPEIEIAAEDNIPSDIGDRMSIVTSNEDLKEYIKKANFQLTVRITMDELTDTEQVIKVSSVFAVDAKILGQ